MENQKIRVAITHGDTNGIGYELIFKTFADAEMLELCTPIIYGSPKIAAYHRKALDIQGNFSIINSTDEVQDGRINLLTCFDEELKVDFGHSNEGSGKAALLALDKALTDYRHQAYDVLVNCPIDNKTVHVDGYPFENIARYLETSIGEGKQTSTLYVSGQQHLLVVTEDAEVKDVTHLLTKKMIVEKGELLAQSLQRDFNISNPRIAVLAFNATNQGEEEQEFIIPAIKTLTEKGVQVFGPYTAETFFGEGCYEAFDGVLAMYSDQALPTIKALATEGVVEFNANLPLVATKSSETYGASIAGKGMANAATFRHAIYTAIDIYRNRIAFDEPLANPLQKLYHEKHDEGEKIRFSVSKKRNE